MLCTRKNASLVFGVENGPVLNFGLDSDLGLRISDFLPRCSGRSLARLSYTRSIASAP